MPRSPYCVMFMFLVRLQEKVDIDHSVASRCCLSGRGCFTLGFSSSGTATTEDDAVLNLIRCLLLAENHQQARYRREGVCDAAEHRLPGTEE